MRLEELAEKTPPDRDRYVDFLRAFSIATVVVGHWFIALIWVENERIGVYNAVGVTSGLWLATWVLQVMPLFFFVGGFSNLKTFESMKSRGDTYRDFMRTRASRLLRPTAVFVAVWIVIQAVFHLVDVGGDDLVRVSMLPFGPMWFLFVYLGVIAAVPVTVWLHRRYGPKVAVLLVIATIVVDLLRFAADVPGVGWLNLAFVWLLAHQLGYFYADGDLPRLSSRALWALAGTGLAGLVVLTNIGVYPRSMVGTDVEALSNMNPPTVCIVALTLWLVGLAMSLRDRVNGWLAKKRPWMVVIAANSLIMTVFLWHLTAYLAAIVFLRPLGLGETGDSTLSWWLQRPLWQVVPALLLAPLVLVFGRFERPRPAARPEARARPS
ncbi:MAG: acyltransferase [Actinomycetota bacterium]|nr:acyltransferase [Actinomycetota bacterium]